jgi:hypothetical protein
VTSNPQKFAKYWTRKRYPIVFYGPTKVTPIGFNVNGTSCKYEDDYVGSNGLAIYNAVFMLTIPTNTAVLQLSIKRKQTSMQSRDKQAAKVCKILDS